MTFLVDDYCTTNTAAGNTTGFAALSAAVNAAGGGVIDFTPGKEYVVGDQEFVTTFGNYRWYPKNAPTSGTYSILKLTGCAKPLIIRMNGAKIKCAGNLKYGVFNDDGTPKTTAHGYIGPGAAIPFYYAIEVTGCASVHIENGELDGNLPNLAIGGYFSDTGIQLPFNGIHLTDNVGPVKVSNIRSHHWGLDGIQINGLAADDTDFKEFGLVENCRFEFNGRNGASFVGGKGWTFNNCAFNHQGRASATSTTIGPVASNPCSGVDLEAEGGKQVRDLVFNNCEFVNNYNQGIVADSGTDVDRVEFNRSTFIGTSNYALWPNRPGFRFRGCTIAGTVVFAWGGVSAGVVKPFDASMFTECKFTTDPSFSPTGTVYTVNNLFLESTGNFVTFTRCEFDLASPGGSHNGSSDMRMIDCTLRARDGTLNMYAHYAGRTTFIQDGGTMGAVPGGGWNIVGHSNAGHSEGQWRYIDEVSDTLYPATIDGLGNILGTDDQGDAAVTLTVGISRMVQRFPVTLTADRAVTLSPTGAKRGNVFKIIRSAGGAFNLNVGTGPLKTMPAGSWAEFVFDTTWRLSAYGTL